MKQETLITDLSIGQKLIVDSWEDQDDKMEVKITEFKLSPSYFENGFNYIYVDDDIGDHYRIMWEEGFRHIQYQGRTGRLSVLRNNHNIFTMEEYEVFKQKRKIIDDCTPTLLKDLKQLPLEDLQTIAKILMMNNNHLLGE